MKRTNAIAILMSAAAIWSGIHLAAARQAEATPETEKKATPMAKKPTPTLKEGKVTPPPVTLVVEEEAWYPLRYEPLAALDAARAGYRRREEAVAAGALEKTVGWLSVAASHAMPLTKTALTAAASELRTLASDLRAGKVTDAARMDKALAQAAHSLAQWHYYRAKQSWGRHEEEAAAVDLELAAHYIEHAAVSAHHEFGPDAREVLVMTFPERGKETTTIRQDHNALGIKLERIEKAMAELAQAMK